jgi:hypothetical protein
MTASYPSAIRSFSTKRNILDVVDAADPNGIQEEIVAIEAAIGVNPNISTSPLSSGSFAATSTPYANLSARLANIEIGIVSDSHTQYLRRTGNEIIVNAISTNVVFSVKGAASQSANLQEWRDSSNNLLASVASDGTFTAKSINYIEFQNQIVSSIWS